MFFRQRRHNMVLALRPSSVRKAFRAVKQSIRAPFARRSSSCGAAAAPVVATESTGNTAAKASISGSTPPTTSSPSPHFSVSVDADHGAPQTRVSVGIQAPSPAPSSIHASPPPQSSVPDSPFECVTPSASGPAGGLRHLQTPQVAGSARLSPLGTHLAHGLPSTPRDIEQLRALDETASQWSEYAQKAAQCADRVHSLLLDIEKTGTPAVSPLPVTLEAQEAVPTAQPSADETANANLEQASPLEQPEAEDIDPDDHRQDHPTITNPYWGHVYKAHGVIGEGSYGRVLKVADEHGQCFAAKVVHKNIAYQMAGARDLIVQESYALRCVQTEGQNNKRLVRLLESWEDADNIYFIMVRSVPLRMGPM